MPITGRISMHNSYEWPRWHYRLTRRDARHANTPESSPKLENETSECLKKMKHRCQNKLSSGNRKLSGGRRRSACPLWRSHREHMQTHSNTIIRRVKQSNWQLVPFACYVNRRTKVRECKVEWLPACLPACLLDSHSKHLRTVTDDDGTSRTVKHTLRANKVMHQ